MILEQLPAIADSEIGIEEIKAFILELALRGKLVPQNSHDGSSAFLVKEAIRAAEELRESQVLKRQKKLPSPTKDEFPVPLPASWALGRLGNIFRFIDYRGKTPKKTKAGTRLITAKNVKQGFISFEPAEYIKDADYDKWMTRGFPKADDVLFTTEAPLGNAAVVDINERFALAQRIINLQPFHQYSGQLLVFFLLSPSLSGFLREKATGMTAKGIRSSRLKQVPIPVPPLPEQKRIVARVEELTALCNRLEKAHQTRNKLRDDFTASALDNLTQAQTPDQLKPAWTIIKNNFPTITTTPGSIQKLRQTILQLAIQGKLVSTSFRVDSDDLPMGWAWSSLPELSWTAGYGTSSKCSYDWEGIPVLRIPNVASGSIDLSDLKFSSPELNIEDIEKLQPNDFLIVRTNGSVSLIGRAAAVKDKGIGSYFASYIIRYRLEPTKIDPDYLSYCWSAPSVRSQLESLASTTAGQYNLSLKKLQTVALPLPPLPEQKQIVRKIDELFVICERLEEALHLKNKKETAFAQSVIAHELAADPAKVRELAGV